MLAKKDNEKIDNDVIALIEFDPIKYETIFNTSKDFRNRIFLYNRRRPLAYNRKSLRILQQSHVIPYISSQRVLRKYELNGKEKAEEIRKKLSRFFVEKEDQLDNFFKFSNKKFWRLLKSYVVELFNEKIFIFSKNISSYIFTFFFFKSEFIT